MHACAMPRQPRFYCSGAALHIVQRGNNRAPVFTTATDRLFYLDCLHDASHKHEVAIHGYVLMNNHVHLLASPGHAQALPRMMQTLGRRYVGGQPMPEDTVAAIRDPPNSSGRWAAGRSGSGSRR